MPQIMEPISSYNFELQYTEDKRLSRVDVATHKSQFLELRKNGLGRWSNSNILLVGDKKFENVMDSTLSIQPNTNCVFEDKCSLNRAIELVNENIGDDEYNYVLILGFEWIYLDCVGESRVLKKTIPTFESLIKKMIASKNIWMKSHPRVGFIWVLPYIVNFLDCSGYLDDLTANSLIKNIKLLAKKYDELYIKAHLNRSCVDYQFRVVSLQHILAPSEMATILKTSPSMDYMNQLNCAKISFDLKPKSFWQLIFKNCFDIWLMLIQRVQLVIREDSKLHKSIIRYESLKKNLDAPISTKPLAKMNEMWQSSNILMLVSSLVPNLHHCKNLTFPSIFYDKCLIEDETLGELKERKPFSTIYNIVIVSPFDWILDACHKEDFNLEKTLPKVLQEIKYLNYKWMKENPNLKVFWLLPYPRQHDKFSTKEKADMQFTKDDYLSFMEFSTIKTVITHWVEAIPEVVMISLLDVMLSEHQQLSFIDGSENLLWNESFMTSRQNGSIPLPLFTYKICLVVQKFYIALLHDDKCSFRINKVYHSRILKQCISEDDMKHPLYEAELQKFFNKKKKIANLGISLDLYNPVEEWTYLWRKKLKPLMGVQSENVDEIWSSYGDYFFLRRGPSRGKKRKKTIAQCTCEYKPLEINKDRYVNEDDEDFDFMQGVIPKKSKKAKKGAKIANQPMGVTVVTNKKKKTKGEKKAIKAVLAGVKNEGPSNDSAYFAGDHMDNSAYLDDNPADNCDNFNNDNMDNPGYTNFGSGKKGPAKSLMNFDCTLSVKPSYPEPTIKAILCRTDNGINVDMAAVATKGMQHDAIISYVTEILESLNGEFNQFDLMQAVELVILKQKQMDELEAVSNKSSGSNRIKSSGGRGMITSSTSVLDRIVSAVGAAPGAFNIPSVSNNYPGSSRDPPSDSSRSINRMREAQMFSQTSGNLRQRMLQDSSRSADTRDRGQVSDDSALTDYIHMLQNKTQELQEELYDE